MNEGELEEEETVHKIEKLIPDPKKPKRNTLMIKDTGYNRKKVVPCAQVWLRDWILICTRCTN